jgi:hypothetical protein
VDVQLQPFLTSAPDGGEWSTSRLSCYTPRGERLQYSLNKGLGGPQSRSGNFGKERKSLAPVVKRITIPQLSSQWPSYYIDRAILAALYLICNNNLINFNGYLLTCRLNSTRANYKASTKAQHKTTIIITIIMFTIK